VQSFLKVAAVFFFSLGLSGCFATTPEVSANLTDRFVGKNVDSLVAESDHLQAPLE